MVKKLRPFLGPAMEKAMQELTVSVVANRKSMAAFEATRAALAKLSKPQFTTLMKKYLPIPDEWTYGTILRPKTGGSGRVMFVAAAELSDTFNAVGLRGRGQGNVDRFRVFDWEPDPDAEEG